MSLICVHGSQDYLNIDQFLFLFLPAATINTRFNPNFCTSSLSVDSHFSLVVICCIFSNTIDYWIHGTRVHQTDASHNRAPTESECKHAIDHVDTLNFNTILKFNGKLSSWTDTLQRFSLFRDARYFQEIPPNKMIYLHLFSVPTDKRPKLYVFSRIFLVTDNCIIIFILKCDQYKKV